MIVVVMGVAGSGKTTIGTLLAESLGCEFLDADSLHTLASIDQMSRGVPLSDVERGPWLAAIRVRLVEAAGRGQSLIVACSALTQAYRDYLADGLLIDWVYLRGSENLIRARLERRAGHFAKAELLASQVETLEEPASAIVADITMPPHDVVREILSRLPSAP